MPESNEDYEKRVLRELEGKNIAHYSVLLSAWIDTRMERDKTLVTLSAAAIGLLITLLTTIGFNSTLEKVLFILSAIFFSVTIFSSLQIYQMNSTEIENSIKGTSDKNPLLKTFDKVSISSFMIGVILALIMSIVTTFINQKKEGYDMSKDNESTSCGTKSVGIESLNGINILSPSELTIKSLDGLQNLSPQATQSTPQAQNTNQQQNTQNTQSTNNGAK